MIIPPKPCLDLSDAAIDGFLQSLGAAGVTVQAMERIEQWPGDRHPMTLAEIAALCSGMTEERLGNLALSGKPELLLALAYMSAGRSLLFLERLGAAIDGAETDVSDVLYRLYSVAQQHQLGPAFEACAGRLLHLERSRCLHHVYGLKGAKRINEALLEVIET